MSILDTFMILFETNAPEVKKETEEAKKVVDGLEGSLKKTEDQTNRTGDGFMAAARQIGLLTAGLLSAGAIYNSFNSALQLADQIGGASAAIGIGTETLAAWDAAAKESGGSTGGFVSTVKNLATQIATVDTLGKSRLLPFFKELGIDMLDASGKARPVMDLLPELAEAFEKMGLQKSLAIGQKIGLDHGTIAMLQKGKNGLDDVIKRYKELGVISQKDTENIGNMYDALDRLSYVIRVGFTQLGGYIAPAITSIIDGITKFADTIIEHKALIFGFFAGLAALMWGSVIPAVTALGAVIVAALPVAAVLAFATALALLADDFTAFWNGAPSLTGKAIDEIKQQLTDLYNWFINTFGRWFGDSGALSGQYINYAATGAAQALQFTPQQKAAFHESVRTNNINIGDVVVNTQATDAQGITAGLISGIWTNINHALYGADDGIER